MDKNFEIRKMTRPEMDIAVEWAAKEGWNPGINDAECFYSTYPDGFLMAHLDGKPAGCVSCVPYGGTFGFIGFFIVRPELRGHRIGMELAQSIISIFGTK